MYFANITLFPVPLRRSGEKIKNAVASKLSKIFRHFFAAPLFWECKGKSHILFNKFISETTRNLFPPILISGLSVFFQTDGKDTRILLFIKLFKSFLLTTTSHRPIILQRTFFSGRKYKTE